MATCLMTGDHLPKTTRQEHTILRSLGGRIRSREVSSDRFSSAAGSRIEPFLHELYVLIMTTLGAAHRGGIQSVEMPGEPGNYALTNEGQLYLRRPVVTRDSETNRPVAVLGNNVASMRRIIDQNTQPGAVERRSEVRPPSGPIHFPERAVVCPEIELAALKAGLLSFDHVLRDDPRRFTRAPELASVREMLRAAVMEGTNDVMTLSRYSLGVQYEKIPQ